MSGGRKGGNLQSRSLQYTAPDTPSFLKALQAQVAAGDRGNGRSKSDAPRDQFDALLSPSSTARHTDNGVSSGEDEHDGAQVVVLNDTKHLTASQAQSLKEEARQQPATEATPVLKTSSIASGGQSMTKRRREPIKVSDDDGRDDLTKALSISTGAKKAKTGSSSDGGNLADVKQLLLQEKQASQAARAKKNSQAPKAKHKTGKGLSFSLDE